MGISIEKELRKEAHKHSKTLDSDPIKEVKTLLLENETEHSRILRGLSSNSSFARAEKIYGSQLEFEKIQGKYEGDVFKIDQIKKLAIDYHLRFLQAQYFTGSFDTEVAVKQTVAAKIGSKHISYNKHEYELNDTEITELGLTKQEGVKDINGVQVTETRKRTLFGWTTKFDTTNRYIIRQREGQ